MKIIKYSNKYQEDLKNLLVELQEYIVSIDDWHLNILTPQYRELYFKKTIEECHKRNGVIFIAVENNKAIGMIYGGIIEYDEYDKCDYACPKTGHIEELIVSKNVRHEGLGSKLLNKMEQYFKSLGCEYCHLNVFEPNNIGKNFYAMHNYITRMCNLSKKL